MLKSPLYNIVQDLHEGRPVWIKDAFGLGQAHTIAHVLAGKRAVWLVGTQQDAITQTHNLRFALAHCKTDKPAVVLTLAVDDKATPFDLAAPDASHTMQRMRVLHHLAVGLPWDALVISAKAALTPMPCLQAIQAHSQHIRTGHTMHRQTFLNRLQMAGYTQVDTVQTPGSYAVRGGIIDLFCPAFTQGVRLDLFGDHIDSIKLFDPANQRSLTALQQVHIGPVRDLFWEPKICEAACEGMTKLATTLNYPHAKLQCKLADVQHRLPFVGMAALLPLFHSRLHAPLQLARESCPTEHLLFVTSEPQQIDRALDAAHALHASAYNKARQRQELVCEPQELLLPKASVQQAMSHPSAVTFSQTDSPQNSTSTHTLPCRSISYLRQEILAKNLPNASPNAQEQGLLQPLASCIHQLMQQGLNVWLPVTSPNRLQQLQALLLPYNLPIQYGSPSPVWPKPDPPNPICRAFVDSAAHRIEGCVLPHSGVAVVSQTDLFGHTHAKAAPTVKGFGTTLSQLQSGDLVVHVDHGLGQFHGLVRMGVQGLEQDYLLLTYAGGDKLYLPLQRINLLKQYGVQPKEGESVRLDTLRNKTWRTRKKKISAAVFLMAQQLLQLHARRQLTSRQPHPAPDTLYREFESLFPFELTADQQQATQHILKNMQSNQPMDRLICGDVGYGKTEVAMRAAMLCVLGNRQVIVLAPTTVLAQQHAMTWQQRFEPTGVRVAVMSRLQTASTVRKTLQDLAQGNVDILIGTHRLLSQDVITPRLGLVVV
ncbi:MAG: DEAD/DEAH box helicase, partial [Myxococcota bacterium]